MKKILFRKLLLDYMSFFLIALLSTSVIIWVFQAVNYLDIMIEDGRDYVVYIKYSLLNFPKILTKLYPFVLFFSLYYVTIKYETNNQLIIFWNFGVNKIDLINFIIKISFVLMFIQIVFSSLVVPMTQDLARSYLRNSSINFFENFIKPQRFNDTIKGVTIYSDRKDERGNLYNIYLKKEIDEKNFQLTYAKKGTFKQTNNFPILVLYNGETITENNNEITNFSFSKSDFPLNNFESNTTTYKKTQELSSLNLIKCVNSIYFQNNSSEIIKIENCKDSNLDNIFKEIYKRVIIPFYIPILTLITFLLIITSKENSNYTKIKLVTFLIGLFFIIFSETTIKLISINILSNIYIILIPYLSFFLIYLYLFKKFKFVNYLK